MVTVHHGRTAGALLSARTAVPRSAISASHASASAVRGCSSGAALASRSEPVLHGNPAFTALTPRFLHQLRAIRSSRSSNSTKPDGHPSALAAASLALLGVGAGLACSGTALADAAPRQSSPIGIVESGNWDALVAEVRADDPIEQLRAVETMLASANDLDNHAGLVHAGALDALLSAYKHGEENDALNVNILRVLADIARSDGTHDAFARAEVQTLLAQVLNDCGVREEGFVWGWVQWAGSLVGIGGGKAFWEDSKPKKSGVPEAAENIANIAAGGAAGTSSKEFDVLGQTLPLGENHIGALAAVANVDIRGGMIYHATRCIANLARDTQTHAWLLESDLLSSMVTLLGSVPMKRFQGASSLADVVGDEQRADTVRFAALSVAALAKTAPSDVIAKRGHIPLIALLGQGVDTVAQTYAAGGIRNLARHSDAEPEKTWLVHRELVVDGLVPPLCTALANSSSPQAQVFAALAMGDVMATGHAKSLIICKRMGPACGPFAELLTSGNVAVARACHRAIDQILGSGQEEDGLRLSDAGVRKFSTLCDSLTEHVGPIVRGPAAKGDAVAMGAIAALSLSEPVSDTLVRKGIVASLVNALSSKNEYGRKAMIALARISGRAQHTTEIVLRGGMKAIMQRTSEDGRWEAAALANLARSERNRPDIGHGGLQVFIRAAHSKSKEAMLEGARGLYNLTIGGVSRVLSAQGGALVPLTKIADSTDGAARRYAVGAIAAISELYGFGAKIVELDAVAVLLRAVEADGSLARDVARVFAQLSNHVESHEALAKEGAAAWLVRAISRGDAAADTLFHASAALSNIAYTSGAPHEALRNAGAIAALTGVASGLYQPHVAHCARTALANLRGSAEPVLQHADSHGQVDPA